MELQRGGSMEWDRSSADVLDNQVGETPCCLI